MQSMGPAGKANCNVVLKVLIKLAHVVYATGFYNVPITKLLVLSIGGCSILAAMLDFKPLLHLQLSPHLTIHHQFWRLITSHCAFANSGEMFFGTLLLYTMRVIERQYGSAKYAAFVFLALLISTFLELGILVSAAKLGLRSIPGGPYALIFAMLYQYHRIVPITYRFRIFGITFNDKMFVYILALQIFLSQFFTTIAPCSCGLMAGALYRSDIGSIKQWRFPVNLQSLAKRFLKPLLASAPVPRSGVTTPEQRPSSSFAVNNLIISPTGLRNRRSRNRTTESPNAAGSSDYISSLTESTQMPSASMDHPSEEQLAVLMAMFPDHPRESISRAISSAHNNLSRAVEIMLSTPAPGGSNTAP
ncbi:hypothetical protein EC973_002815 [Apophysomyces ossiformis]|uniref:CUE domain-containing protein n=1 Tax=Apophysomyces ossiformis TaxID=679940 RepID=A0A8H7EMN6_9FUNG|nr:hypothetical protein EC973_002815 [Apophysomyces ossiformis]